MSPQLGCIFVYDALLLQRNPSHLKSFRKFKFNGISSGFVKFVLVFMFETYTHIILSVFEKVYKN